MGGTKNFVTGVVGHIYYIWVGGAPELILIQTMATREGVDEIFENFITEKINLLENPVCVARRLYAENVFGQYEVLCKLSDSIFPADQRDQKWIVFRDCLKDGFPVTVENLVRLASVIIECDVVKVGKKLLEEGWCDD